MARFGRALLVLALLLLATTAAACDDDEGPDCDRMTERQRPESGVTALLADVSASVRGGTGRPDYTAALTAQIEAAVQRGDHVYIGTFDGSSSSVRWTAEKKLTFSFANREKNRELDRAEFTDCLKGWLGEATRSEPEMGGTDVLAGIFTGADAVKDADAGPRTVVVGTDGLSTTGCLDLTGGNAGKQAFVDKLIATCPVRDGWGDRLAGVSLIMAGVGHAGSGQSALATGHVSFLGDLWRRVCETAGAALCDVSTLPVASSGEAGADGLAADPDVPFVPDAGAPDLDEVTSVRTDLLFDTDSAVVRPEGRAALQGLAVRMRTSQVQAVKVIGHADRRATDRHNLQLSKDRAAAVAKVLTDSGISGVTHDGRGERDATCPAEKQSCLQRDRRVDIIATTVEG
ncbi:hypothetical protein AMIS_69410 [Actinoplanes missouriensis 431]|uniref:OmpA-like domain-containing protein n=1 Tax=Actinoplanes missouriensis (strain ATCC 14538 / DSM 43046 / CBS 188.64 / JCM 3121 / NBRC 102363 / NCIMB 12654 / NRRL B-3342 / UNCC 431) TaxID=512565 RepID=I0HGM4_ACTM4|nr:OmpA family protein [Actinoplanes missouriensis]BAL92161.1 hypothetical protein AMIS_69410 [Actinoplanes missouriensis 431]